MPQKPAIPKGTRDFTPEIVAKRNYIIGTIKNYFERYGFRPIETPSFENTDTLLGKYGEEGDRLIFKILNSGDFLSKVEDSTYAAKSAALLAPEISGKALRYDLTVPFARYVVMHQHLLDFPFKRYQIQPVWRADRPQKGRFREFYQCDADVVGTPSPLQEVDLIQLYDNVFTALGLHGCTIKMNNRKVLAGIAEVIGAQDKLIDFTVALDKLDKIGVERVKQELQDKGISATAIERASPLFLMEGEIDHRLDILRDFLESSAIGIAGVQELEEILDLLGAVDLKSTQLQLDVTLARGLNYYTGSIFEVAAPTAIKMGSIGGGGRYDDLTGMFGLQGMGGVGISFGLDRIYLVLEEMGLFPETLGRGLDVLCLNFGREERKSALALVAKFREAGLRADLYPNPVKVQKQFKYASKLGIPYTVLLGSSEIANRVFVVKNMVTGEQKEYDLDGYMDFVTSLQ